MLAARSAAGFFQENVGGAQCRRIFFTKTVGGVQRRRDFSRKMLAARSAAGFFPVGFMLYIGIP